MRLSIFWSSSGVPLIQKFIVSAMTSCGRSICSSTSICRLGWMLPSMTKGVVRCAAGIFGWKSAKTFSSVESDSRLVRSGL